MFDQKTIKLFTDEALLGELPFYKKFLEEVDTTKILANTSNTTKYSRSFKYYAHSFDFTVIIRFHHQL